MSTSGQSLLDSLRETYTKPYEVLILDWLEENALEDVIFYPQENPTILITWIEPDNDGRYLFREIDVVIDADDAFRVSGGAIYHAPTYHLAWLPYRQIGPGEIAATLDETKRAVDALQFEDLTDMESYLNVSLFRLEV